MKYILTLILSLSTLYTVFSQEKIVVFECPKGYIWNQRDSIIYELSCEAYWCRYVLYLKNDSYTFYTGSKEKLKTKVVFLVTNEGIFIKKKRLAQFTIIKE
jgi:hypothetical protein